jgi:AcrR family transcriptional regulator
VSCIAKGRGRPRTQSDAARRTEILEAAQRLFIDNGYERTTTDAVAAACHISKQTLYRLYPSKTALFEAIVDQHRGSMLAFDDVTDAMPIAEALAVIFRIDISVEQETERRALLHLAAEERDLSPELSEAIRRRGIFQSRVELGAWLARRSERGEITIPGDPTDYSAILMAMVFTSFHPPGFNPPPFDQERHREHVKRCIAIFLDGTRGRTAYETQFIERSAN